jgi:hypothetical protein
MRTLPRTQTSRLTALSLLLALGAGSGCREASPLVPDAAARDAHPSLSAATQAAAAKGPDPQDYLRTFARDVFVIVGSTLRNPDDATEDSKPLFNNAGVALGLTWGDWKRASATSTAHVAGPWTQVQIELTGLVPGGVYSLFYINLGPDSENPACPGVERGLPLLSSKPHQAPDASSFVAGSDGTASFHGKVAGDLLSPMELTFVVIYHFDGRTYGSLPNAGESQTQGTNCRSSFGEDAMRQLLIVQKAL